MPGNPAKIRSAAESSVEVRVRTNLLLLWKRQLQLYDSLIFGWKRNLSLSLGVGEAKFYVLKLQL